MSLCGGANSCGGGDCSRGARGRVIGPWICSRDRVVSLGVGLGLSDTFGKFAFVAFVGF